MEENLMGSCYPSRCRQPPPPPRRCNERSLSKREANTSMVRRPYLFRRCKKVPASSIESLPDELLSEILVRVSADDICANAMVVCRKWYQIIHSGDDFINAQSHLSNSDCGLLLTTWFNNFDHPLFFLGVRQGRIEISYKSFQKGRIQIPASCNGLVLCVQRYPSDAILYVLNLTTKQSFSLPPSDPRTVYAGYLGIAYAAASMVYKVVRAHSRCLRLKCDILTVGVENSGWRSCTWIDSLPFLAKDILREPPFTTEGFMHWTSLYESTPKVLTLNVETEIFTESCCAPICGGGRMVFLSTGRRLSLLSACGDWMWEVWEMEAESGDWRKFLPNIDLEAHKSRIEQAKTHARSREFIIPFGWIKYPLLLALRLGGGWTRTCFVYNLDTDEIDSIELPFPCSNYKALVHRNSLEWLS